MAIPGSPTVTEFQTFFISAWKEVTHEVCNYIKITESGRKRVKELTVHNITLSKVLAIDLTELKKTDLFKTDPDIAQKLNFNIKRCITEEENSIKAILNDLQNSYCNIMGTVDKIWSLFKEKNLNNEEIMEESLEYLSVGEMLELIDKFKRSFSDSHDGRKYSLDFYFFTKDHEKIISVWDTAEILSLKEELDQKFL